MDEQFLNSQLNSFRQMAAELKQAFAELTEDEDALRDTAEGETGINPEDFVCECVKQIELASAMASGAKARANELMDRARRFDNLIERLRFLAMGMMDAAAIKKIQRPEFSASLKATPAKAEITDEALIPSEYWKPQDPKLDRMLLTNKLKEGVEVPGAVLSNAGITIAIKQS